MSDKNNWTEVFTTIPFDAALGIPKLPVGYPFSVSLLPSGKHQVQSTEAGLVAFKKQPGVAK